MTMTTVQFLLVAFGLGLMCGSIISYTFTRRLIKRNMKSLSEMVTVLNSRKAEKEQEYQARKDSLLLLANKLKHIETNMKNTRRKEYHKHISGLNRILDDIGIAPINSDE